MYITSLTVKNFRNLADVSVKFDKQSNVIIGDNAQGKTNVLEAVYTAINGKSFRTKNDVELIDKQSANCLICLQFVKDDRPQKIDVVLSRDNKKKIAINEVAINKISDLIGYLNVVLFAPEDLKLVKGGPADRRRFLNRAISSINRNYLNHLIDYHHTLSQKNKFLKLSSEAIDQTLLDVWDEQLAVQGCKVVQKRAEYIALLSEKAAVVNAEISNNCEVLKLKYQSDLLAESSAETEQKILQKLKAARQRDIKYGYTTVGPQRDDLQFVLNNQSLHNYGSQGQQRSALLSLKLAQIEMIKAVVGEPPILMLDDVMSELDSNRQIRLLKEIKRTQTILTTTDLNGLDNKDIAPYWRHFIADGSIQSSQEVLSAQ